MVKVALSLLRTELLILRIGTPGLIRRWEYQAIEPCLITDVYELVNWSSSTKNANKRHFLYLSI